MAASIDDEFSAGAVLDSMPEGVLQHVLCTATTHGDMVHHLAVCARVHPRWWRVVRGHAAYAGDLLWRCQPAAIRGLGRERWELDGEREKILRLVHQRLQEAQNPAVYYDWEDHGGVCQWPGGLNLNSKRGLTEKERGSRAPGRAVRVGEGLTAMRMRMAAIDVAEGRDVGHYWIGSDGERRSGGVRTPYSRSMVTFGGYQMGDAGGKVLAAALCAMLAPLKLVTVNLSNCDLTPAGMSPIAASLRRGFGPTTGIFGEETGGLRRLNVSDNLRLGDAGIASLAAVLPATLLSLELSDTQLGNAGLIALTEAFPGLTELINLDLHDNPLVTQEGWAALGKGLPSLSNVRTLDVSRCSVGALGMAALAPGISAASVSLECVDLQRCQLGDIGAKHLGTIRRPANPGGGREVTTDFLVYGNHIGIGMPDPDTFHAINDEEANPFVGGPTGQYALLHGLMDSNIVRFQL